MENKNYQSFLNKASSLCSKSEKCKYDIKTKLINWGLENESDIKRILDWLIDNQFIDEKRYSRFYTLDKHRFNKWGKIKIRAMLKSKYISDDNINLALSGIDPDTYLSTLKNELVNKRRNTKATNQYDLKGKLFRFASSKGYESDLIYQLMNDLSI